ncbi:hypothetical protein SLEP1_g40959 [Rubroshorea leprosula]|uniref:Uncharacterized protein n=1 Tax=Rubroshorea leprosula TaxID=152421 RepID=A0AAV5L5G8_9ROSI|nr:hypothetical protein SLEP1_g40959 [Rubroshorea leprosula]
MLGSRLIKLFELRKLRILYRSSFVFLRRRKPFPMMPRLGLQVSSGCLFELDVECAFLPTANCEGANVF